MNWLWFYLFTALSYISGALGTVAVAAVVWHGWLGANIDAELTHALLVGIALLLAAHLFDAWTGNFCEYEQDEEAAL